MSRYVVSCVAWKIAMGVIEVKERYVPVWITLDGGVYKQRS
jgi:hypothetical protein